MRPLSPSRLKCGARSCSARNTRPTSRRLRFEPLEDRRLLRAVGLDAGLFCTWYVDDNAPSDPAPGDPSVGDPLEDGTEAHPFDAIQQALDAAEDGDTVVVLDGTYSGVGNRDIDFGGRAVTVRSDHGAETCIISCDAGRGFYFHSGEDQNSVLDGFTITHGRSGWGSVGGGGGGAILCDGGSPTIANCRITGNHSDDRGGGIHCRSRSMIGSPPRCTRGKKRITS